MTCYKYQINAADTTSYDKHHKIYQRCQGTLHVLRWTLRWSFRFSFPGYLTVRFGKLCIPNPEIWGWHRTLDLTYFDKSVIEMFYVKLPTAVVSLLEYEIWIGEFQTFGIAKCMNNEIRPPRYFDKTWFFFLMSWLSFLSISILWITFTLDYLSPPSHFCPFFLCPCNEHPSNLLLYKEN